MNTPTPNEIHAAVDRLNQSTVGQRAMDAIVQVDETQRDDVATLLRGLCPTIPTLIRQAIREALVERARR